MSLKEIYVRISAEFNWLMHWWSLVSMVMTLHILYNIGNFWLAEWLSASAHSYTVTYIIKIIKHKTSVTFRKSLLSSSLKSLSRMSQSQQTTRWESWKPP
jgi:hypothetical protein